MQKWAKNEVLGHFFEFGWLDWPDIADSHRQSRFSDINIVQGAGNCHDLCIISIITWKSSQWKSRMGGFLPFSWNGVVESDSHCSLWR